jgi:hypothetical protein
MRANLTPVAVGILILSLSKDEEAAPRMSSQSRLLFG